MKVIFLEDVPNIGKAGQIKDVAEGYGRNYLIPRKLAAPARTQDIKNVEAQIKARARIAANTEAEMKALAADLKGKEIKLKARSGQQERLYGSITTADISAAMEKQLAVNVDKKKIELAEPIHQLGNYEVSIRLGKDIMTSIKVVVEPEKES
ncbi:MAG: 50S ribosomal protein L9 [Dehalococcoidales bacterium]|nr:50S ribosomal protein L9 [Dehalococcoidales bacterium]